MGPFLVRCTRTQSPMDCQAFHCLHAAFGLGSEIPLGDEEGECSVTERVWAWVGIFCCFWGSTKHASDDYDQPAKPCFVPTNSSPWLRPLFFVLLVVFSLKTTYYVEGQAGQALCFYPRGLNSTSLWGFQLVSHRGLQKRQTETIG